MNPVILANTISILRIIMSLWFCMTNRLTFPKINKADCADEESAYIEKLTKVISDELQKNYDYFSSFDLIINYYDYG